jgi:hypothetical protein
VLLSRSAGPISLTHAPRFLSVPDALDGSHQFAQLLAADRALSVSDVSHVNLQAPVCAAAIPDFDPRSANFSPTRQHAAGAMNVRRPLIFPAA